MEQESVTLKLPRALLSDAQRVATARDVTIGHLVRVLLEREVARQLGTSPAPDADRRLVYALQALLARDLAEASDWDDLAARLRPHGYAVAAAGKGLAVIKVSCGTALCKLSDLGFAYGNLVRRFGAPLPAAPRPRQARGQMPAGGLAERVHARLSEIVAQAEGWQDLSERLAREGMELRPMGAGLAIYRTATGRHLCNTASVGARYRSLVRRFGGPMPGHPHQLRQSGKTARRDAPFHPIDPGD